MNSDKIYFNNIVGIGNLRIDYIIFEFDYPVLFTCVDNLNNLYLCVCCDIRSEQRFIISKTKEKRVIDLLSDRITIREAFENEFDENYIVKYSKEKPEGISKRVKFNKINPLDLPTEGEYLEAEDDEFTDYICILESRIITDYKPTYVGNCIKVNIKSNKTIHAFIERKNDDLDYNRFNHELHSHFKQLRNQIVTNEYQREISYHSNRKYELSGYDNKNSIEFNAVLNYA